jgi:phage shock protein C
MYCTQCGLEEREGQAFCSQCGKQAGVAPSPTRPVARLLRVREGKKIAGVCAGFARYIHLDVTVVRIVWLLTALTCGVGFIAYIVAWIAMPVEDAPVCMAPNLANGQHV